MSKSALACLTRRLVAYLASYCFVPFSAKSDAIKDASATLHITNWSMPSTKISYITWFDATCSGEHDGESYTTSFMCASTPSQIGHVVHKSGVKCAELAEPEAKIAWRAGICVLARDGNFGFSR